MTGWNPAATALFGYAAEEAVGRQIDDLVFDDEHRQEGREITRGSTGSGPGAADHPPHAARTERSSTSS